LPCSCYLDGDYMYLMHGHRAIRVRGRLRVPVSLGLLSACLVRGGVEKRRTNREWPASQIWVRQAEVWGIIAIEASLTTRSARLSSDVVLAG
jgi:hypothetical protein